MSAEPASPVTHRAAPLLHPCDLRTHANFYSHHLANERTIIVYVPPGYEAARPARYPVLYLQDGQNLFDGTTAFIYGQDWQVGQTAQYLITTRAIRPLIIVGIYNTGLARVTEYTPTYDARFQAGGKADLYGRMLRTEIKPFIDANYRTLTAAADTGLGGSSLGGLVALYLACQHPHVFGHVAALSPSVFWGHTHILHHVAALPHKLPLRIWLDTGTAEGPYTTQHARALRDGLTAKGWQLGHELHYHEAADAQHNELAWRARVGPVLKFLYPHI